MKQVFEIKDKEIIQAVFDRAEYGTLALSEDGKPYSVPVNFVAVEDVIYFHGAQKGRKMSMISNNASVSFSVVENYALIPSYFSSHEGLACPATQFFKSIIIDGDAVVIESRNKKAKMFDALMRKLQPEGQYRSFDEEVYDTVLSATAVIKIVPKEICAKFKFGQHLNEERFMMIIEKLRERGDTLDMETLHLMEALRDNR